MLRRFQSKTRLVRPLVDGIEDSPFPAVVLKYLDGDVLDASNRRRLTRPEVKYVARCVLGALSVLHREGFVHTGKCKLHHNPILADEKRAYQTQ